MKKIALALVALTAAATPAFAQDEAAPFNGAHVSAVVGYDILDLNTAGLDNPDGLAYGVNLGYDLQRGNVLFGIEGEVTESTAEVKAGNTVVASAGRDLYVGGRLGYVLGKTAIYGKAGYTNARVESVAGDDNGDGFRVGGGVERKFGQNLFGKVEYRYSNYEADVERHQVVAGVGMRF
ncbi:porin family protein [Sphingomonas sp. BT-65]|uniref:outer membrane protein n=1 Tax=Sphingomonas sp. BT-65 TaxID=2989821 RepID=UPI002235FE6E|nr:porin family protein [Sphingomonas sp. BT-65]MCW4461727.1 porin family protein [Sphingomonas sp. BT-65]